MNKSIYKSFKYIAGKIYVLFRFMYLVIIMNMVELLTLKLKYLMMGIMSFMGFVKIHDSKEIKLIAFYLPQFHPIPENNVWWGDGFTEWTNVKKAKPLFKDHYQPREPSDEIGYYDLLNPEVQQMQVELAKEHGIHGICFYHNWFNGKKMLEKPVESFVENKKLDFPFCLCWANEPWTRKWDGYENQVLQPQTYGGEKEWIEHYEYLIPALKDERAIRIDGRPIFLIYRIGHIENVNKMIQCWRELAKINGLPEIYLIAAVGNFPDNQDFTDIEIDAVCEFAPNCLLNKVPALLGPLKKFEYDTYWQSLLKYEKKFTTQFRGAFVSFDNTARVGKNPRLIRGATPEKYRIYLNKQIKRVLRESEQNKLIFINAWNEWGEACYLEPDKKYGRAFLEATKKSLVI